MLRFHTEFKSLVDEHQKRVKFVLILIGAVQLVFVMAILRKN